MSNNSERTPRLKDVAHIAGVSHQTVSRVINQQPHVRKTTRDKVEAAVAELGYRRNSAARSLVTRQSRIIGVLASALSQYGPANTLLGVEQAARNAGYFTSVAALREVSKEGIRNALTHLSDQAVDGIIVLIPHAQTLRALDDMKPAVPVIAAGSPGTGNISGAMVDQRHGARLAVAHLVELGHTRIGHISGPLDWTDSHDRTAGWREALQRAGLAEGPVFEGDWSAGSGYQIGRAIASAPNVTALFVSNDQMALGVLRAFTESRVRVPEDVSIVGFDDQPESGYFSPPLTTVVQDFEELGRRCVDNMLQTINATTAISTNAIIVKPRLVERVSTAPPK